MEAIKQVFTTCKAEGRAALVTYVTAGFPTTRETPEIMLSMQAGGSGKPHDFEIHLNTR
jgi:tryptophan synthase